MVLRGLRDLEMVRRLMKSAKGSIEAKKVKEAYYDLGFRMSMSLYGVISKINGGRSEYRRIEVLSTVNLNSVDVELIYRWFQKAHPIKTYSIWIYEQEHKTLRKVFDTW